MISIDKSLHQVDSIKLAEYILYKGGSMSHLKLQKLLYYVQAYHLAYFDSPLIEDDFEAWVHGPVSRKLYNSLKDYSILYREIGYVQGEGEELPESYLNGILTEEQKNLIDDVIEELSDLTGFQLENMTHSELPWINARKGYGAADKCTQIISKEAIEAYFKRVIYEQEV